MAAASQIKRALLYGYHLSPCSWRVRAALYMKKVPFEEKSIDIANQKYHLSREYKLINPAQKVPAMVIDGRTFVESMAILQYLEDTVPQPSLVPECPLDRAHARSICETIVSGIQPLQNVALRPHFNHEGEFEDFSQYWIRRGLQTLEALLKVSAGRCCVGHKISMADLCLVPQIFAAVNDPDDIAEPRTRKEKYNYKQTLRENIAIEFPTVCGVYDNMLKEDMFHETHPNRVKIAGNIFDF